LVNAALGAYRSITNAWMLCVTNGVIGAECNYQIDDIKEVDAFPY
jgi:hypothetical protein